jgi:hypothetical protein
MRVLYTKIYLLKTSEEIYHNPVPKGKGLLNFLSLEISVPTPD